MNNNIVFTPGRQMYHFVQLRQEVGDLQLIGLMAERLINASKAPVSSAVRTAADQFDILEQLQRGEPVFSDLRSKVNLVSHNAETAKVITQLPTTKQRAKINE